MSNDYNKKVPTGYDSEKVLQVVDFVTKKSPETRAFHENIERSSRNRVSTNTSRRLRTANQSLNGNTSKANQKRLNQSSPRACGAEISRPSRNRSSKQYHSKQGHGLKNVLLLVLASTTVLSFASNVNTEKDEPSVTNETLAKLDNLKELLKNNDSSNSLEEINFSLDDIIDDVMSDLVTKAFESETGNKVTNVEHKYDFTRKEFIYANAATPEAPNSYYCDVTYLDADTNKEETITIREFNKEIEQLFDYEYKLDYSDLAIEDYKEMFEDINEIATTKNFDYSYSKFWKKASLKTEKANTDKVSTDKNDKGDERDD